METEAKLRRQGNSVGLVLGQPILQAMGLSVGQTVTLITTPEGLLVVPQRPRFSARELNAQCDFSAPPPTDLEDWEHMPAVGLEQR